MAGRWRGVVALGGPRVPPAADLPWVGRVADVDGPVGLIVKEVAWGEVGCAAGEVHGLAIDEPKLMDAAGGGAGAIEEANGAWLFGDRDVEHLDTCGLQSVRAGLVGDGHEVAANLERVGTDISMGQRGLNDDAGAGWVGDIDAGEVLGRAFVSKPKNAAAAGSELQAHTLAEAAEALQGVMGDQPHVILFRLCHT